MVEKSQEVTDYIQHYPIEIQERLEKIRELIHQEAPEAVEKMSHENNPLNKVNKCNIIH